MSHEGQVYTYRGYVTYYSGCHLNSEKLYLKSIIGLPFANSGVIRRKHREANDMIHLKRLLMGLSRALRCD